MTVGKTTGRGRENTTETENMRESSEKEINFDAKKTTAGDKKNVLRKRRFSGGRTKM